MLAATTGAVITTRTARQRPDQKKTSGVASLGLFLDFRGLPATWLEIRDGGDECRRRRVASTGLLAGVTRAAAGRSATVRAFPSRAAIDGANQASAPSSGAGTRFSARAWPSNDAAWVLGSRVRPSDPCTGPVDPRPRRRATHARAPHVPSHLCAQAFGAPTSERGPGDSQSRLDRRGDRAPLNRAYHFRHALH